VLCRRHAKVQAWLEDSLKRKAAPCSYFLNPDAEVKLDAKAKNLPLVSMGYAVKW